MKIPLNSLERHNLPLQVELQAAATRVLVSGWYIMGPELQAFEKEFATFCGARHAIGVANGTEAIEIALRAVGCGPGDEVLTVANAGMYSTTAILAVGSTPVYADISLETLLIDPDDVQHRITPRTKAIVATHLYGRLCRIEELKTIADQHGIVLVEDCAQAHGAMRGGIRAGAFGAVSCFSFFPTKNLGALGDAGAIVTSDDSVAQSARTLRQYGWSAKYDATTSGGRNSRLDEVQAAMLRVKLPMLDQWNSKRRAIAGAYLEAANGTPVSLHVSMADDYVAHLCVTRTPDRQAFARHLDQQGVENTVHYPIPDYAQKAVAGRCKEEPLERTEAATNTILTLPCFPEMSKEEVSRVCGAIATFR